MRIGNYATGYQHRPGKSKTEKLAPFASLVGVHHLRSRTGLAGPEFKVIVWGIVFICGMVLRCAGKRNPILDYLQQICQPLPYIAISC